MLTRWGYALVLLALICGMAQARAQMQARAAPTAPPDLIAHLPENPSGRLAHILRRGSLIVGVKTDYRPWGMLDDAGRIVGLEPDLAHHLADSLGVDLQLRAVTASNRIGLLNQGQVDLLIATMGDTAERRRQADLLEPGYSSSGVVLYGPADRDIDDWQAFRGQKVCLNRGAYYNRILQQEYGVKGLYFSGNREARMALLYGRCAAWAFDDTALAGLVRERPEPGLKVMDNAILTTPWVMAVALGEGEGDLGRFVAGKIGEWHGSGLILALQEKWGLAPTRFLTEKHALWSRIDDKGRALCARLPQTGQFPATCLDPAPLEAAPRKAPPAWVQAIGEATGLDLSVLANAYDRSRLARGLGLTLALAGAAISGSLLVGVALSLADATLAGRGWLRVLLVPQRILITVSRMTPPILQLYIVFFGLGGALSQAGLFTPGAFAIAALIFSLYAGSTNAVILSHALDQERRAHPERPARHLLPAAIARGFDGLVATCVNIVKAAGMASAIALGELISTVNLLVSEGADARVMMNGLLVIYFLLVLSVIWLLKRSRGWLARS